jgi:hypothetical protein
MVKGSLIIILWVMQAKPSIAWSGPSEAQTKG